MATDRRHYTPAQREAMLEALFVWLAAIGIRTPGRKLSSELWAAYQQWATWAQAPAIPSVSMFTRLMKQMEVPEYRVTQGRGFLVPDGIARLKIPDCSTSARLRNMMRDAEAGWWGLPDLHGAFSSYAPRHEASPRYIGTIMTLIATERRGVGDGVEFLIR